MGVILHLETMWASPYGFSSFVALREKRVPFTIAEVSLLDAAHQVPAFRDRSLTAKIPALEHDGFWIAESSAIAEYLEDAFPPPAPRLLPADLRARARARQLMAWIRSDLGALRDERPTVTMFFARATRPLSRAGEADAAKLVRVAESVIPPSGGPLFGAWSLPDAELAFMLHRLLLNRDPVPERIAAWALAEWQRPSAQEFIGHARPAACPEAYWKMPANAGATVPWV